MNQIERWLYPDLEKFPLADRESALRKAKETEFDTLELVGIGVALAIVVGLTRYSAAVLGPLQRILAVVANFFIAIPLLAFFAGPFYVRRVRRGLKAQIDKRSS